MRRISQCFNQKLADILSNAIMLTELNNKLIHYLPEQLQPHFHVGSFNQGCLIMVTHDPVWASQLRFHLPHLRDNLRKQEKLHQLASIQINVIADDYAQISTRPKKQLSLSTKAQESIRLGSELCEYEPLKKALEQLATHVL
jgi:hypothetical protein